MKIGSYVWYYNRQDPVEIMRLFQHCDVILIQRFPLNYTKYFGNCQVIENWKQHGMLVKGPGNITYHELPNNNPQPNMSQGKYIPVLDIDGFKIISSLPSYNIDNQNEQLEFVMGLADDNSVIVGDMHWEDTHINNLYIKYQLINHIKQPTFTGVRGERLSLDKVLTKSNISVSDVIVHEQLAHNNIEHYPLEFTIHV